MNELLQVQNLVAGFPEHGGFSPAVDGVDLQVSPGRIIGVVGESGCGKTMLVRAIMGLIKPPGQVREGSILWQGTDLLRLPAKELQKIRGKEISMIFQEPMSSLNPVVPVGKQVAEVLSLHAKLSPRQIRSRVVELFQQVGIPQPASRLSAYPHELSGGLRQRVMIAMAMACSPQLLLADEPTTALDVTIEAQILRLMERLRRDFGASILLISHNLGVVAQICDWVYVMYAGRIVEQAPVLDLFESPRHPYTRGLLEVVRAMDGQREELPAIGGTVAPMGAWRQGCAFAPRCPYATDRCRAEAPALTSDDAGHKTRCFQEVTG